MSKSKKKKLPIKTIKKLKKYWKKLQKLDDKYFKDILSIEKQMQKEIDIKDLEFFWCDGWTGIGNASRTIKLIHFEELEK